MYAAPIPKVVQGYAMTEDSRLLELVAGCIDAVKRATDIELDFTQDTLPVLDHYAGLQHETKQEVLELIAPMCGAYYGEVLKRELGEAWWHTEDAFEHWRLEFAGCLLHFNPVGTAMEVLAKGDAPGWFAHLQTAPKERTLVETALQVFGEVPEDRYHLFTTHFEATDQVYNALMRSPHRKEGLTPQRYRAIALHEQQSKDGQRLH